MPIATRLTANGTFLVNGIFDEYTSIAPSKFRTTSNTVYASQLDEYTINSGSIAKRENFDGTLQIKGFFDEFTGAPVIDNSLKLWLDAGQNTSYSGTGTTWTDMSSSGANATLFGAPTYSSTNYGGAFTFVPASSQYANTSTNLGNMSTWTIEATFKVSADLTNQVTTVLTNIYNGTSSLNFSMGTNNAGVVPGAAQWNICVGFFDGSWRNTTGFAPVLNTWYSFTVTNSAVEETDVILINQKTGTNKYDIIITAVGNGSFQVTFSSVSGTTNESPVFNFAVIKAVTS